jgi:hypothetical protein
MRVDKEDLEVVVFGRPLGYIISIFSFRAVKMAFQNIPVETLQSGEKRMRSLPPVNASKTSSAAYLNGKWAF